MKSTVTDLDPVALARSILAGYAWRDDAGALARCWRVPIASGSDCLVDRRDGAVRRVSVYSAIGAELAIERLASAIGSPPSLAGDAAVWRIAPVDGLGYFVALTELGDGVMLTLSVIAE